MDIPRTIGVVSMLKILHFSEMPPTSMETEKFVGPCATYLGIGTS